MGMGWEDLMTSSAEHDSRHDFWRQAVGHAEELESAVRALQSDEASTLPALRSALHTSEGERGALLLLALLDVRYVLSVVDELVSAALSHRNALRVRQILGRASRRELAAAIPPAVWHQLEITPDDDAYRRLAELLSHLGLDEALGELTRRAIASDDPNIQEVGQDF
jgi:hypothetical protein